ncbi:hypothetical protein TSAR_002623 [Trichomalopsis sarcophagae]|uniref:alpha-glucosidase n=1 Tax=Trichomalopsis sarcophagae TaxID=543379 RepID=A0A232EEQ5_9HYME|nr:hypothetical protein TSAR_002623 [Trichomalopsis sarcophagae]
MTTSRKLALLLAALLLIVTGVTAAAVGADDAEDEDASSAVTPVTPEEIDEDEGSGSGSGSGSGDGSSEEDDDDDEDDGDWREDTLIYQVWPRAFQDSNGDGEGDLQGIIHRLDYFVEIGVDTIRLSPIYSSPMIDAGYDVLNHTDIDPIYGDFNDFYELIHKAHKRALKIILDVVPNQSSDQHEWFLNSTKNVEPYDDYYVWADGKIVGNTLVPPTNWKNAYSEEEGSAWTWNQDKRMWYYHQFHHTAPDLNLRNEDVVQEILNIFDFWLDKEVDGFCICGASYLFENEDLLNESSSEEDTSDETDDDEDSDNDEVSHTIGLPENSDLLVRFREHIEEWVKEHNAEPKLLIAEVDDDDDEVWSYYGNETHPGIAPLSLVLVTGLNETSDAGDVKDLIEDWMERLPEGADTNWMLSNQDYSRASSRLDSDVMDGLYMLTLLLPGQAVIYYGEEIGMLDTNVTWDDTIDIRALDKSEENYDDYSRDPVRTPMQWDNTISGGFSTNDSTFLPVNPNYVRINVKRQLEDHDSNLMAFKKLALLRENPIFTRGDYDLDAVNDDNVLILKRSLENDTCLVIINFADTKQMVNLTALYPDLEEDLQVMVDSSNANVEKENDEDDDDDIENDLFILHANAAAVLCDRDDFSGIPHEEDDDDDDDDDDDNDDDDSNDDESDSKEEDDSKIATTSSTEEPNEVVPATTTEAPAPSSANRRETLEFFMIIHLALLLLLRTL